jgi:phage FluMu protein Com
MRDYRCRSCGRLLFRSPEPHGRVDIVCPERRCRVFQTVLLESEQKAAALTPAPGARRLTPETA